jgi:hypothetical protein
MLVVDRKLRKLHVALADEGYRFSLGPAGCVAWFVRVQASEVSARRDSRRIAEHLLEQAPFRAEATFEFNETNGISIVESIIAEAVSVASVAARPTGPQMLRSSRSAPVWPPPQIPDQQRS